MFRRKDPIRGDEPGVGLVEQPGNHPISRDGRRVPAVRRQRGVKVSELRPETGFPCGWIAHSRFPFSSRWSIPAGLMPGGAGLRDLNREQETDAAGNARFLDFLRLRAISED
jgi:hypothetical protein